MKKLAILLFTFLCTSIVADAQIFVGNDGTVTDQRQTTRPQQTTTTNKATSGYESPKGFDKSKLTFGGNLGLQFGDYTIVDISPQVGYMFSKYVTVGIGLGYTYSKEKFYDNYTRYNHKMSYATFNAFGRFYPIDFIVINVQPGANYMWRTIEARGTEGKYSENKFVPTVVLGGGVRFGPMTAMIQYDVVQDKNSPYGDNIFYTIGYSFGL